MNHDGIMLGYYYLPDFPKNPNWRGVTLTKDKIPFPVLNDHLPQIFVCERYGAEHMFYSSEYDYYYDGECHRNLKPVVYLGEVTKAPVRNKSGKYIKTLMSSEFMKDLAPDAEPGIYPLSRSSVFFYFEHVFNFIFELQIETYCLLRRFACSFRQTKLEELKLNDIEQFVRAYTRMNRESNAEDILFNIAIFLDYAHLHMHMENNPLWDYPLLKHYQEEWRFLKV